jgi:hypothetical protein
MEKIEIEQFENYKGTKNKGELKILQTIYLKHNPTEVYNCLCNPVVRKIKAKQFFEWYDKARN